MGNAGSVLRARQPRLPGAKTCIPPAGEAVYTLCVLERVVPWQALPEVKALLAVIGRRLRHGRDADEGRAAKGATPRTGRAT